MNNSETFPIGVFDSGVGGLTVTKEIIRQMPGESIVYFGDTKRVPYGDKPKETVIAYSRQIVRFLLKKKVKAIVIACNTITALAMDVLSQEFDIPIIGVVEAGAIAAVHTSTNGNIGIVGTTGTVQSGIYPRRMQMLRQDVHIFQKACPLLCPMVEQGMLTGERIESIVQEYVLEFQGKDIDILLLGCTHYPLLSQAFAKAIGEDVRIVDPAIETSKELKDLLIKKGLQCRESAEKNGERPVNYSFYVSDRAKSFAQFAKAVLPKIPMEVVEVEPLGQGMEEI